MEPELSPSAVLAVRALLTASCVSWLWITWKLAQRQNPLPREPRPAWQWSWESLPQILGFHSDTFLTDVALGVGAFVVAAFPVFKLQELLTHWFQYEHPMIDALLEHRNLDTLIQVTFGAVIMAPLVEELFFRRLVQGLLEWLELRNDRSSEDTPNWFPRGILPILASSTLFALAHLGQGPAPAPLFVFALLLGYLHLQTHRIVPSIVAHACLNAFSLALVWTSTYTAPAALPPVLPTPVSAVEARQARVIAPVKSASSAAVIFDSLIA